MFLSIESFCYIYIYLIYLYADTRILYIDLFCIIHCSVGNTKEEEEEAKKNCPIGNRLILLFRIYFI